MKSTAKNTPEHIVMVRFNYGIKGLDALFELENALAEVISKSGVGKYDGHDIEMDRSNGTLFMYGPDAELLFKTIQPVLKACNFMKGAKATLLFGPPEDGVKEMHVEI